MENAELAIINGNIITVDQSFSLREAVAVKNGLITAVGSNDDVMALIGPQTKVIDLKGLTMLPGINDSHMHLPFFGATRPPLALDLRFPTVKSIGDMVETLRLRVAETKPGEWIRGFGWDQSSLEECRNNPDKLPRKWDIDSVSPDHPVIFSDFSGHSLLVNSKALAMAGITRETPDPPSGELERDATGEPTGIFKELAAQSLISVYVPLLTRDEKKTAIRTALQHLNAQGITSVTDAAIGPGGETFVSGVMSAEFVDLYQEVLAEGNLTVRVSVLLLLGNYGSLNYNDLEQGLKTFKVPAVMDKQALQFPGVKIFADGIPLTYTAWMNDAYISGNFGHGRSVIPGQTDQEQHDNLVEMIKLVHRYGYQIGVHATGDRAADAAVAGFTGALQEIPGDRRHYIVHGDFISPDACAKLAAINCGVAMQPTIKTMISDFETTVVGEIRAAYEWPTRTAINSGLNLTFSSDAPVTYPHWLLGVENAVLRESLVSGKVSGPEECISVEEALKAYTINGAYQDHMEDFKGSIEVGKAADFCVIDRDILSIDPHEIRNTKVVKTILNGTVVYEA